VQFFNQGTNMSLNAISMAATALPTVNFHPHGHRKGAHPDSATASPTGNASGIGQLPVGASTSLFSNLVQSLEQVVGAQSAGAASTPVGSATAGSATGTSAGSAKQELQAFMHSLFQVLKQDGLGSSSSASAPSAAGASTTASAAAASGAAATGSSASAQYQGSLVSSLQTLIHQLGASGTSDAATANLSAAFQNLISGPGGNAASLSASSNTASSQSPNAGLQSFLNTLLQNLQGNGVQALNGVGNNVNANV
jgi:hypothetical protein